jgi:hypothetical protein
MRQVKGYRIIDIPLGSGIDGVHSLYLKEHSSNKVSTGAKGKVLFVGNVDYRVSMSNESVDEYLRLLFTRFGDVTEITVSSFAQDSSATARFAHVSFAKKSSLGFCLSGADNDYKAACQEVCDQFGFNQKKKSSFEIKRMFPFIDQNPVELQNKADATLLDFDEREAIMKREREARLNQVDEDGFMPVKHRSKRKRGLEGPTDGAGDDNFGQPDEAADGGRAVSSSRRSGSARSRGGANGTKGKKQTELKNFYRFQIKEQKMKELDTLRKKFAEDKERVAKLKDGRKFKPF